MSGTFTHSNSNTFSASNAKYVFGKMKDDFMNVAYRGFTTVDQAQFMAWWEDIVFVANEQALVKCELQFSWQGGAASIIYEVVSDGGIEVDGESATHDFRKFPDNTTVNIVMQRDPSNAKVSTYLQNRRWSSSGSFLNGSAQDGGGYSKGGYGLNMKTIGI